MPARPATAPRATLAAIVVLLGCGFAGRAQDPSPPAGQDPAADRNKGIRLDAIAATVGDTAILESRIAREIQARIQGALGQGHRPTREEIERWEFEFLRNIFQTEAMAQAARIQRGSTPQQVDQVFEQFLADQQRAEIENAGSLTKYSQQLDLLGTTWPTVREERRTTALAQLAEQRSFAERYRDLRALWVTPAEMRRYYERHRDRFHQEAAADVEVVVFPGGNDPAAAAERATAAAAAWRQRDAAAADIAAEFGGRALAPRTNVRDHPDDDRATYIKQFATNGTAGAVSEPIAVGNNSWVLRIARRIEAVHRPFDDPTVQQEIQVWLVAERRLVLLQEMIQASQKAFQAVPRRAPYR